MSNLHLPVFQLPVRVYWVSGQNATNFPNSNFERGHYGKHSCEVI